MKHLLLLFLFLFTSLGYAQNLVPNPSFEEYDLCPNMESQFELVIDWMRFRNSAEYFNACDVTGNVGVPNNMAGFQPSGLGRAYAGIYTYSASGSNPSFRDFIGVPLTETLAIGVKYFISFKVSPTLSGFLPWGSSKYISNNVGALVTTFSTSQLPIANHAHFFEPTTISDTVSWTTVSGSFVADSAYKYLVIGNFFHDSLTTALEAYPSGQFNFAYLYLDDVCLSTDSAFCASAFVNIRESESDRGFSVFPNPALDKVYVSVNKSAVQNPIIEIMDSHGRIVEQIYQDSDNTFPIDIHHLPAGIYGLRLTTNEQSFFTQLIKLNP